MSQSCLVVNGEKTNSSDSGTDQKGKGDFRFVGSFVKENKGFIMFETTRISSTDKQLDLEGGIYFVKKEGESWSLDKYKTWEGNSKKKVASDTLDKVLPKPKASLNGLPDTNKNYWGFVSGTSDLANVCKQSSESSTCPSNPAAEQKFKGAGTGSNGNTGKLDDGVDNLTDGGRDINSDSKIDMTTFISSQQGTGTKVSVSSDPAVTN